MTKKSKYPEDVFNTLPYIYVLCKGSRIQGEFYGVYIDATQEIEDIEKEIEEMLEESPSRYCNGEWIIGDYPNFCGIGDDLLGWEPRLEVVIRVARFIVDTQEIRENCQCFDSYYDSLVKYTKRAIKECTANAYKRLINTSSGNSLDTLENHFEVVDNVVALEPFKPQADVVNGEC